MGVSVLCPPCSKTPRFNFVGPLPQVAWKFTWMWNISNLLSENIGVLLDTYEKKSLGGTGTSFDWNLAHGIAQRENTFLAGGLNNNNIDLAIKTCSPWGIDVSSGVESNGEKNPKLITSFIRKIKSIN